MEKKQILIAPYKYSFKPASYDIFDMCNKDEIDLIKNKYPNDEYKRIFIIVDRNEESIKDFLDSEDSIMHCGSMISVGDYLSIAEDESKYDYIIRSKAFSNAESVIESEKVIYIENLLDEMEVK
jgi:hypothetical protein